jgi:uncharacterized repeat protein (TIGR01451 family)
LKQYIGKFRLGIVACAIVLASIGGSKPIMAQYYSQGNNVPSIVVDKKVRPISNSVFYDNIDPNVKVFSEGEQIEFKITVTNNSSQVLYNVELKDILPKYLDLLFYPGVYNKSNNVITGVIDQLNIGESKDYFIRANISGVPTTTLAEKNILQINKTTVGNNLVSDSDQAQYFIEAKNVPPTGADDLGLKTLAVALISVSAVGLRKLARGY